MYALGMQYLYIASRFMLIKICKLFINQDMQGIYKSTFTITMIIVVIIAMMVNNDFLCLISPYFS